MEQPLFSSGTTQKDRTPKVLLPDYINVEEKTISDYLNFIQDFSGIIQYWNVHNYAQGSFQEFFKEDLSFLLAYINTIDINEFPLRYNTISKAFLAVAIPGEKEQILVDLLLLNLELAKLLESWYKQIMDKVVSNGNTNEIEVMIREIVEGNLWKGSLEFEYFYKRMWMFFIQNPSKIAKKNLPASVHFTTEFFEARFNGMAEKNAAQKQTFFIDQNINLSAYEGFFNYLQQLYVSLYTIVSLIQQSVPSFLNQSLQIPNHSPQVTLLLAFWEMQQQTNQLLNQFTQKHLDYYYFDVLQQKQASSIPDQTLLSFTLSPSQSQSFIPKGTPFLAGASPSGQPLLYTSDSDLTINNAQAIAFKTLYNGTIGQKEFGKTPGLVYASPIANSGDGVGAKFTQKSDSWASLGKPDLGPNVKTVASLGFALSNPVFFLSEGTRNLTLVLELSESSVTMLRQELAKLNFTELTYWEILELLVNESFSLKYTSLKGWTAPTEVNAWMIPLTAEGESGGTAENEPALGIAFFINISHTQPAVVAYNAAVHGEGYSTTAPIIQFEIAQNVSIDYNHQGANPHTGETGDQELTINPYSLFSKITIKKIPIYLEVKGVQDFVVQNDFSVLSPKKPYPPFGVAPLSNNHFYLGNNEIFRKDLSHLSLTIDWYDLPKLPNGFCDYYQDYNRFQADKPFYNSAFKWELDMLVSKNQTINEVWKSLPFSSKSQALKPSDVPPVNPSDPPSNTPVSNDSNGTGTITPPETLTPELAQQLLGQLSQYYGANWSTNAKISGTGTSDAQIQVYTNTNIKGKPVIVNTAFVSAMNTINGIAKKNKVTIYVTRSFMASSLAFEKVVTPVNRPNHLVGHAIDFNLIYQETKIADANYLSEKNKANWDASVKGFIDDINAESSLNWGGNSSTGKSNHIDDDLFKKDRQTWNKTYETVQEEWKTKPLDLKPKKETGNKSAKDSSQPSIEKTLAEKIITAENQTSEGDNATQTGLVPPQALSPKIAQELLTQLSQYLGSNWKNNAKNLSAGFNPELGLDPPLTVFTGRQFQGKSLVADLDFLPALQKINELALENQVVIQVVDSFEPSSVAVADLKTPIEKPNHLVGHAFDFKLIYEGTKVADADYLKKSNEANWAPSIKGFIDDVTDDDNLNWGGNLTPENPGHIDDNYYAKHKEEWNAKYTVTQAAWKADPLGGTIENNMFEWNPPVTLNTTLGTQDNIKTPTNGQPLTGTHKNHSLFKEAIEKLGGLVNHPDAGESLLKKITGLLKDKPLDKSSDKPKTGNLVGKIISGAKDILKGKKEKENPETPTQNNSNKDTINATAGGTTTTSNGSADSDPKPITCPYQNEGTLKTQTQVEISDFQNINKSDLSLPTSFSSKETFNDQSVDGFLRFTLTNPPYAFGGSEYARIVAAVANYNMELIANKVEKALDKKHETADLKALLALITLSPPILQFLEDPILKVIDLLGLHHLQKLHKAAVAAANTANATIEKGLSTDVLESLNQQYVTIMDYFNPLGQIISQFSGASPGNKTLFKNIFSTFKSIFGHHPLLGGLGAILGKSIPFIGTISKVTSLLKPFLGKGKTAAIGSFLKKYHTALSNNQKALTLLQKAIIDAHLSPTPSTGSGTKAAGSDLPLLPPRPAYIPKISKITATYSALAEINLSPVISDTNISSQFFHLDAFGIKIPESDPDKINLLPIYTQEGHLYIALEEVSAPEIVTLLFTINEGSGNRDAVLPKIDWSYLDNGQWTSFTDIEVKDGTNGFVQSGVISFNLPNIPLQQNRLNSAATIFVDQKNADEYYWLRARAPKNADAVCEIINVYAQATTASYASGDIDPNHFAAPLPEKTISKLQKPNPDIAKIVQPVPSFGGKASEDDAQFYARVNERLRHKGRAVSSWDYERLILQQFPSISLARCLNHTSISNRIQPGNITVLILPQNISATGNLLSPKTDQGKIKQVKAYLQNIIDPFVKLDIRNPSYQYIQVDLKLTITPGIDPGHTLDILNQGLINEIAPWNVDYQNVNPFEVSNSYYSILEYLYSQTYVEEVFEMDLTLLDTAKAKTGKLLPETYAPIKGNQPWILISSVAKHQLTIVTDVEGAILLQPKKEKKKTSKKKDKKKQKTKNKQLPEGIAQDGKVKDKKSALEKPTNKTVKPEALNALYIGNNIFNKRNRK